MTSCLGHGLEPTLAALLAQRGGLRRCDFETVDLDTWIGAVDGVDDEVIEPALSRFDCRNNRLAQIGLRQDGFADAVRGAIERHGPDRVGVFLGTSTAGILQTETRISRVPSRPALPALVAGRWFNYAEHAEHLSPWAHFVRRTGSDSTGPVVRWSPQLAPPAQRHSATQARE